MFSSASLKHEDVSRLTLTALLEMDEVTRRQFYSVLLAVDKLMDLFLSFGRIFRRPRVPSFCVVRFAFTNRRLVLTRDLDFGVYAFSIRSGF